MLVVFLPCNLPDFRGGDSGLIVRASGGLSSFLFSHVRASPHSFVIFLFSSPCSSCSRKLRDGEALDGGWTGGRVVGGMVGVMNGIVVGGGRG